MSIREFDDLYFWGSNFPSYSLTGWDINQEFIHWPAASGCRDATFSSACILHNSLWKSVGSFHAGRTRKHTIAMSQGRHSSRMHCFGLFFIFPLDSFCRNQRTLTLCKVWLAGLLCAQYEECRSLFGCCPMELSLSLCVLLPRYFPPCPVLAAFFVWLLKDLCLVNSHIPSL